MFKIIALAVAIVSAPAQPLPSEAPVSTPTIENVDCASRTFASIEEAMQSGCCSWHNGVCGCSNGRKKCCDGTLSPSCTC